MLNMYNTKSDFEKSTCKVAILPIGAIEQHGGHLPVGTDTLLASEFGKKLAEVIEAYLLPVLPISSSIEHRQAKGTVYIRSETLMLIIRDIAQSLQYSGFEKLIIANVHGGNWIIKPTIRNLNRDLPGMQVVFLNVSDIFAHRHHEIFEHVKNDVHAGEFETSLMMYLHPQLVSEIKVLHEPEFVPQAFMDYFDTSEITDDGCWGYPEAASSAKGKRAMELLIDCALEYLQTLENVTMRVKTKKIEGIANGEL